MGEPQPPVVARQDGCRPFGLWQRFHRLGALDLRRAWEVPENGGKNGDFMGI